MTYLILIGGFLVSALSSLLLTPALREFACRRGWVDQPGDARKVHAAPIPRVGGVAIMYGFTGGLFFFAVAQYLGFVQTPLPSVYLLLGALAIGATGFYDDVRGLGFKRKFVVQLVVAYLMIWAGYRIDLSALPLFLGDGYNQALLSVPLTLVWIIAVVNAVNLLDGLDGLAAGVSIIAFLSLAACFGVQGDAGSVALVVAIVGATAGFLVHNFNPATIFMGDSGSMFLGFLLALYALDGGGATNPLYAVVVPLVAVGLPLMDTSLAFVRRIASGKSPFFPDRDHIHHRIVHHVRSHRSAVQVLYAISTSFGAVSVLLARADFYRGLIILAAGAVLVYLLLRRLGYLDVQGILAERRQMQRHMQARKLQQLAAGDGSERMVEVTTASHVEATANRELT